MLVASDGLIVGYSDESLVGEKADEKLAEYSEVLRRVTTSQEHGRFQVTLDGQPCVIFSSETSNHWYLILSVGTDVLYAADYQQVVTIASINLLMLLVVAVFYIVSTKNRRQAAAVLASNTRFVDDYDTAVHWLNSIAQQYPNTSVCYMANPYAEHPVIMNTGWVPGDDYRPELYRSRHERTLGQTC